MQQKLDIIVKNNKYGLINQQQEIIIPCIYDDIYWVGREYYEEIEVEQEYLREYCYLAQFDAYLTNSSVEISDHWLALKLDGLWGFVDSSFQPIMDFIYDDINTLNKDYLIVQKGHQYQFIYYLDNELIYSDFYDDIIAVVDKHISYDNTELFPYLVVQVDNKKSIIHIDSKTMTSTFYDDIIYLHDDYFSVKQDGKYAVIDIKLNVFTPFIYDEVIWLFDNLLKVKQANKYGIINEQGDVIIPILYDDIDIANEQNNDGGVKSSCIVAALNGKIGYFNRKGQLVKPFADLQDDSHQNTSFGYISIIFFGIFGAMIGVAIARLFA